MKQWLRVSMLVWSLVGFAGMGAAQEKDTRTPLQKYEGGVIFVSTMCQIEFRRVQVGGEGNLAECIETGKVTIKADYERALKTVRKAAAKAALKEHYIAGIAALQGISPQFEELKSNYDKRQGDNKNKLDALWVRFETEN